MPDDAEERRPLLGGRGSVQDGLAEDKPWYGELPQGNTSWYGAIFIIVNAALGAGLLAFPVAFYWAGGVWQAMLVMMVKQCMPQTLD